jgi:cob(I)alamin adenosyltransferase
MTIYTRSGDQGETDLLGGPRVSKDAARLEVCGDLDELDAWLGLVRCETLPDGFDHLLDLLQRRLVGVRSELATVSEMPSGCGEIASQDVELLERAIDRYDGKLTPLETFILPGGSRPSAMLHVARAVCRRAERRLVSLLRAEPRAVSPPLLCYVNRLSDLLYVLARAANGHARVADAPC